jgi:hypothetical protein
MDKINFVFEVRGETNLDQAAHALQEQLGRLEMIESAEAFPEGPSRFTGMEAVAAIGVAVALMKGSRDLISETRKAIKEIKLLVKEYRELKQVWLEIGPERVPLDEVTEEHLRELTDA